MCPFGVYFLVPHMASQVLQGLILEEQRGRNNPYIHPPLHSEPLFYFLSVFSKGPAN